MTRRIFYLVQVCAFLVFIGRAYQFYFFGAPFREFFWDEDLLSPVVEGVFDTPWYDYATSSVVNTWIVMVTKLSSFIFLLSAIVSLFWQKIKWGRLKRTIIWIGIGILIFMGFCLVKSKNNDFLQFFEQGIQIGAPLLMILLSKNKYVFNNKLLLGVKIAIALVFTTHGLFAMGLIYVPGHFVDMTIKILGVSEAVAKQFLFVIGLLDVIASILIFIPKLSKYAFYYLIIWGILTAFARIVSGFSADFIARSFHHFSYLVIYRIPHGLFPLIALLVFNEFRKKTHQSSNTITK